MSTGIVGARIRESRRAQKMTQAELARRLDISPSYMNLIERNRRPIAGRLLARAATELGLRISDLDGQAERRLLDRLREVAADQRLRALKPETAALGDLIGRYPGWARAIGALARSEREQAQVAAALADRLSHDPFLAQTVHQMLTHVAALRSTSEILNDVDDLEPAQQRRFQGIISVESRRLSAVAEALAAYFDKAHTTARAVTPLDEVEALFAACENRFPALENDADPEPAIDALIAEADQIETESAAKRGRSALAVYAADARALPLAAFADAAAALGYDIEAMARQSGEPVDRICRRLTTLPKGKPRFGYVAANAAGALIDLRAIPGFTPFRNAPACPLWVLARAQQTPERAIRQVAEFPDGERLVFVARARITGNPGFGEARHYVTDMLAMSEADARGTVYAAETAGTDAVGTTCRVCPREGCGHRVEDPLTG